VGAFAQARSLTDRLENHMEVLRTAEFELRTLLDDLPSAVIVLSSDGRIREANATALEITGRTHAGLLGRYFADLLPEPSRRSLIELWLQVLDGESVESPRFRFDLPDDTEILLEASMRTPVRNPNRVVIDLRDISEEVRQERALAMQQRRFRMAFEAAPTGMALAVSEGVLIDVNETLAAMLGYSRDELVGRTVQSITHPDDWDVVGRELVHGPDAATSTVLVEKRYVRQDGTVMWANTSMSVLHDSDAGSPISIAHIEDITERRRDAERLEWAATHDELTKLPNRFRFLDLLGRELATNAPGTLAVLFVDLDNFKVINDSLGHAAGDQLLRTMGDRLRTVVRDRDLLGRFGGDEFIVMLGEMDGAVSALEIAERLRQEVAKPMLVDDAELFTTASIGIALADAGCTTSDLLRNADAAMYRAKARGRNCVEVFAPGGHEATVIALRTTNELRRGLERGEVLPYFQPIVDLADGRLHGFEVLARWRHPDRGLLGPEQFLGMAEETGLIGDVGAVIMRSALVTLGAWQAHSIRLQHLTLSINVSVRQLMSSGFLETVGDALIESGVEADSLWLEITETALMSDTKAAGRALRDLRSIGLHLSVDDFGTGYSSLTYLKRFPVESIKVDRSFVSGLGIDNDDSAIVEAVVGLGQSLGLTVVAEGVETPLQLNRLREIGCDFGQGYLFGRPRPADLIATEYGLTANL
jgi:diguanylate cyclase (GGDEF)-like protein/PAS domain S-box-containing protein